MRRFNLIAAAFILVIILLAVEIIIVKSASKYEPSIGIVFAKVRIPEKTIITSEMLETKKVGISFAHRQSIRDTGSVVSKKAGMDIEAGEMILSSKLGSEGMEEIAVKDKSKRLFSVEFKGDQANGWWLLADQNVDLIFIPDKRTDVHMAADTAKDEKSGMTGATDEKTVGEVQIIKNIRIAALIDDRGQLLKNSERTALPRYVSFEVTDEQASFLAYAKGNGRLEISVIPRQ